MARRLEAILLIAALAMAPGLAAEEPRTEQAPAPRSETSTPITGTDEASRPVYKPPLRGAPGGRIGGGTRGGGGEPISVDVLAPDHTGLTARDQPTLYFLVRGKTMFPVELTVVDPRAPKPLLELRLDGPVSPGVHALRLSEHNVRLEPGVAYRWYVAIVQDPGRRSRDVLAGGAIERVTMVEGLRGDLAKAPTDQLPSLFAAAGLWYDALAALHEQIEQWPGNALLRKHRAAMLAQVGLGNVPD